MKNKINLNKLHARSIFVIVFLQSFIFFATIGAKYFSAFFAEITIAKFFAPSIIYVLSILLIVILIVLYAITRAIVIAIKNRF
jgi:hypothetical protein